MMISKLRIKSAFPKRETRWPVEELKNLRARYSLQGQFADFLQNAIMARWIRNLSFCPILL